MPVDVLMVRRTCRLSLRWSSKMPPQDEGLCVTGASDPRIARAEGRLPLHFCMMRGKSSPNSVSQLEK